MTAFRGDVSNAKGTKTTTAATRETAKAKKSRKALTLSYLDSTSTDPPEK
jgi:hypothetical protein